MKPRFLSALTALFATAGSAAVAPAEGGLSKTTILVRATSSWNGVRYAAYPKGQPELTTVRISIPANSELSWHRHLMLNIAYLVSGALTVEDRQTGQKATYKAGQAFAESVGSIHRGVTGNQAAVIVVTYAGAPGLALSVLAG